MTRRARRLPRAAPAALALSLACAVSGCAHGVSAAPVPTSPVVVAEPNVDAAQIDSLLVGVDEIKTFGFASADATHTDNAPVPGDGADPARPCSLLSADAVTSRAVLGAGWQAFRQASVSGSDARAGLREAIVIYPDQPAAQTVFRGLTNAFNQCRSHPDPGFTFGLENPIRLTWTSGGQPSSAMDVHLTRNAIYAVSSSGVGNDPEVAAQTADQIKTNIVDPA